MQKGFGRKYSGDSSKEYWVGIGDTLQVTSPGIKELSFATQIGPDGRIPVPIPGVGRLKVAGLTASEIEARLTTVLSRYFKNVNLVVSIPTKNSKRIFLTGAVRRGGILKFEGDQTMMDVMARSSVAPFADTTAIIVWRADPLHPEGISVDLDAIMERGDTTTNILLKEDDIIFVPLTTIGQIASNIAEVLNAVTSPLRAITGAASTLLRAGTVPYTFQGFDELADRASQGRGGLGGGGGRNNNNNFF